MLGQMAQGDRQIAEKDRCPTCKGDGWTWWSLEAGAEGKWIVCRECIGTGRVDQKGRKRLKPEGPAAA
jgi:DnaJ-class molecular chaperone